MDQYFGRMRSLMNNKDLPARIRFLLQDTVELRENNWVPRKAFFDNGPKTIHQIRHDAVKVSGSWMNAPHSRAGTSLRWWYFSFIYLWTGIFFFFFTCRIWAFSSQHLCRRAWGWTSSWKAPSCPTELNWTGRRWADWPTCLDKCRVWGVRKWKHDTPIFIFSINFSYAVTASKILKGHYDQLQSQ